jgi:hypothetical protein
MNEIREWLEAIGLSQYADAVQANDIDMDLLRHVDDQTLKDISVSRAQVIDYAFAVPLQRWAQLLSLR